MLDSLKKIKSSREFKDYQKSHPNAYLCSIFITDLPQFSFYSKKTKLVTSFKLENNKVSVMGKDQKIFQKEKKDLKEINLEKIKISLNKAKQIANSIEKYKNETTTKEIIILQILKQPVWNITKITSIFNIINIKLSAITGKIISHTTTPALSFRGGLAQK